jgi:osmotically-inducible protein OsmY
MLRIQRRPGITMRLIAALIMSLCVIGCTSMMVGSSGKSAGKSIGQDERAGDQFSADRDISAKILNIYATDAQLSSLGLTVETRNGGATIRGIVKSFEQRDRAINLAADVAGVLRIDNQISINSR